MKYVIIAVICISSCIFSGWEGVKFGVVYGLKQGGPELFKAGYERGVSDQANNDVNEAAVVAAEVSALNQN